MRHFDRSRRRAAPASTPPVPAPTGSSLTTKQDARAPDADLFIVPDGQKVGAYGILSLVDSCNGGVSLAHVSGDKHLAISPFTMPAALAAADTLLGDPTWSGDPDNPEQMIWLDSFRRRAALAANMSEIRSNATESFEQHVAWLLAEGWEAQVSQGGPGAMFLAATLNIVAKWREVGCPYNEQNVDRVLLKAGAYTSAPKPGEQPVVEVLTQNKALNFCFQKVATAPTSASELAARALDMASRSASEQVHLDFPMVDLRVRDDAAYMLGLRAGPNMVTQAAEQLRLELNDVGGRASAAAEIVVTRSLGPRTIKIDGPFVVAIIRNGAPDDADKVVFAAYCPPDVWRKPADGRI